jgi:hypothetical protein
MSPLIVDEAGPRSSYGYSVCMAIL